jgi:hypothetical protein
MSPRRARGPRRVQPLVRPSLPAQASHTPFAVMKATVRAGRRARPGPRGAVVATQNSCVRFETRGLILMTANLSADVLSSQLNLTMVLTQHGPGPSGAGASSMRPNEVLTAGDLPTADLCPWCGSSDPPLVTLVSFSNQYCRCAKCGFLWSEERSATAPTRND